jgi:hypothetical protein
VDWKKKLSTNAFKLLQNPRVAAALQDPRVAQGLVQAFKLRSDVERNVTESARKLARALNLATAAEIQELRRAVSRLERQLEHERRERAEDVSIPRAVS